MKESIEKINNLSHIEMVQIWRFAEPGHPYTTDPLFEFFKKRLFEHFGGITPSISKIVGWEK